MPSSPCATGLPAPPGVRATLAGDCAKFTIPADENASSACTAEAPGFACKFSRFRTAALPRRAEYPKLTTLIYAITPRVSTTVVYNLRLDRSL